MEKSKAYPLFTTKLVLILFVILILPVLVYSEEQDAIDKYEGDGYSLTVEDEYNEEGDYFEISIDIVLDDPLTLYLNETNSMSPLTFITIAASYGGCPLDQPIHIELDENAFFYYEGHENDSELDLMYTATSKNGYCELNVVDEAGNVMMPIAKDFSEKECGRYQTDIYAEYFGLAYIDPPGGGNAVFYTALYKMTYHFTYDVKERIVHQLSVSPAAAYEGGKTAEGSFTIKNKGNAEFTIDRLTKTADIDNFYILNQPGPEGDILEPGQDKVYEYTYITQASVTQDESQYLPLKVYYSACGIQEEGREYTYDGIPYALEGLTLNKKPNISFNNVKLISYAGQNDDPYLDEAKASCSIRNYGTDSVTITELSLVSTGHSFSNPDLFSIVSSSSNTTIEPYSNVESSNETAEVVISYSPQEPFEFDYYQKSNYSGH